MIKQKLNEYLASMPKRIATDSVSLEDLIRQLNRHFQSSSYQTVFRVNELGQLCRVLGESSKVISNCLVIPTGNKTIYYLGREEHMLEVYCLVNQKWSGPFSLTAKQLRNDKDWIRNSVGFEAIILDSYKYLEECINLLVPLAPILHEYNYIGWAKKHPGHYITGSEVIGRNDARILPHPSLSHYQLSRPKISEKHAVHKMFDLFFKIGPADWILPSIAFSLLSQYKSLLDTLHHVPDFVMYVYGKSGSRKTTVSKLLFNPFDNWDFVPLNFTATTPAMETVRMERRDCVTLIDDIPPSVNPQEHKATMSKLEAIFRSTGDSVGRKKMISSNASIEMKAGGMAAITAEDLYVKSTSSIARGYFINVSPDTINLSLLTEAQRCHDMYSAAFYYYLQHISKDVEKFVLNASMLFKDYERIYSQSHTAAHGRQIASSAWLSTSMHLYLNYALNIGGISDTQYSSSMNLFANTISSNLTKMVQMNDINDEVELFVRAIKEMIISGALPVADVTIEGRRKTVNYSTYRSKVLGFRDGKYLYFLTDSIYSLVCSYYKKQGKVFPVTEEALWNSLKHMNLLTSDNSKDGTKTVRLTINGTRISVIRIDRLVYESWGETPFDLDNFT